MNQSITLLAIDRIDPNPFQPRRHFDAAELHELAESIQAGGIIQPLVVRSLGDRYQVIAGERRLRAARLAGLTQVPAIVREMDDRQSLESALVENLQRSDLGPIETAQALKRLIDEFRYTQAEVARRTGKSRPAVANVIRLLQLEPAIIHRLEQGELSEGHGRALLQAPEAAREDLAEWAIRTGASVRQLERRVNRLERAVTEPPSPPKPIMPEVQAVENQLREHFGTRVSLNYSAGVGQLTLEFYGADDLERILDLMGIVSEKS